MLFPEFLLSPEFPVPGIPGFVARGTVVPRLISIGITVTDAKTPKYTSALKNATLH